MVAKKKRTGQLAACSADKEHDILEIIAIHDEAKRRWAQLLQEARALEAAGKKRAARKLIEVADEIQLRLRALEDQFRGVPGI